MFSSCTFFGIVLLMHNIFGLYYKFSVDFFHYYAFELHFSRYYTHLMTFSWHCLQRDSGLAQRRLTLNVLRATSVNVHTSLSAELLPPLRQTACCVAVIYQLTVKTRSLKSLTPSGPLAFIFVKDTFVPLYKEAKRFFCSAVKAAVFEAKLFSPS